MKINMTAVRLVLLIATLPYLVYSQVLETEESKPLLPGQIEIGTGLEFQTSNEGTETALPIALEYGISRKITLLVEPVGFTSIRPKIGPKTTGGGDLEMTLFYQIIPEQRLWPSISVSGEVKLPTTRNKLIGTGKTDYTPYLIASKTIGKFYNSLNLSYTFLGKPKGVVAYNLFNYGFGTIYKASPKSILYAEIYGNTSAMGGGETVEPVNPNINTAELSGGETVGAVGYGRYVSGGLLLSLGINYDNNKAILLRPGIEWKF